MKEMQIQNSKEAQESTALIIFGVTGDLARRKLVPALYELLLAKRLPMPFYIIGFARRDWDDKMPDIFSSPHFQVR